MKLYLIVAKGNRRGLPIPIVGDLFLMGSDDMCQLRSKMQGIAPQHCALNPREKKVFIRDMGQGGETFVNRKLVPPGAEWPLHAGDHITVGPLEFLVQFNEKQLSQKDAEEWALRALDEDTSRVLVGTEDDSLIPASRPNENASNAAANILDRLQLQKGVVKGRLRVAIDEGILILRFNDMYLVEESEISFIRKELLDHIQNRKGVKALLDFKNVRRMSSSAGEMILEVYRRVRSQSGKLAICRVRQDMHAMLRTLNVLPTIPYFIDRKHAAKEKW